MKELKNLIDEIDQRIEFLKNKEELNEEQKDLLIMENKLFKTRVTELWFNYLDSGL